MDTLKNKKVSYRGDDKTDLTSVVEECRKKCSYSTEVALENILPDLEMWSKGPGRKYLSEAIGWYVTQIKLIYGHKEEKSPTFFSMPFIMNWENFALFFQCFPSPAYIKDGILFRTVSVNSDREDKEFIKNFEAATTIWSHRIMYDFLCSENPDQLKDRCMCPLYDSCQIRPQIEDDYTCKTAPWEIIKNEKKIICQYGMATHSFGLWQNTLDIRI